MKIILPTKKGASNTPIIDFEKLVVIGANGSGKTRFGSRIEERYLKETHRISAQKSLNIPPVIRPTSFEQAKLQLQYGSYTENFTENNYISNKITSRWDGKQNTFLLNDFENLLILLHTEEYQLSLSYKEGRIEKPITKLDKIQNIWESVLPDKKLVKGAGIIETYPTGRENDKYNSSEMSDGERVIFYLIGEVICAPANSIIIIDEPEMHIHKSIIKHLFDLIENERSDCSFIYLTHEMDFAISRPNATKIWIKNYERHYIWDYEILESESQIPEQLYLEILGNRKNVLFIEGDYNSIDYKLYEHVFPNYYIKPLGSCQKVIHSVKALNEQKDFHHIESFGLIDKDRMPDSNNSTLNPKQIWILDVAEAENLLLLEGIIKATANHMGKESEEVFQEVQRNLINFFQEQLIQQTKIHFKDTIIRKFFALSNFKSDNVTEIISEINKNYSEIDIKSVYDEIICRFKRVIAEESYLDVLKFLNLKKAIIPKSNVCSLINVKNSNAYLDLVITLMKKKDSVSNSIISEIKSKIIRTPI